MSLNKYQDIWGRYHDKVANGEIVSNNGWIYTAYANKFGLNFKTAKLKECLNACDRSRYDLIVIDRSPNDPEPPLSKD